MVLETVGLTKKYGTQFAVSDLNIHVKKGEVGLLTFIAMLPVLFIALMSKKGFLLSVCVTFVYALISFIGIWSPVLSSVLPIISILRICNITALSIKYAFPMSINLISMVIIGLVSFIGIIYAAKKQEA